MNTLVITEKFDKDVFNTNTDFGEVEYNLWLQQTAIPSLEEAYEALEESPTEQNVIGDLINMLVNTRIVKAE